MATEALSSLAEYSPCAASASGVHPAVHPTRDFRRNSGHLLTPEGGSRTPAGPACPPS
jgi:hypothetical protein